MFTWKPKYGKTTVVHKLQNTLWERNTTMKIHRGNDLLLPFFATRGGYSRGNDLSFSLSLSLSLTLSLYTRAIQLLYKSATTTFYTLSVCPKSYFYIYMTFGLFIHVSLPIGWDGSEPGLRSSGSP